jgi:hypothetical protein
MSKRCFAVVITYSYLDKALVLIDSLYKTNSNYDVLVLIVDMTHEKIEFLNLRTLTKAQIIGVDLLDDDAIFSMRSYFNALEFCSALKYFFIDYLLEKRGYDHVVYIDPDCYAYSEFNEELFGPGKDVIITPHVNSPPIADSAEQDLEFMKAGFINAGFMAVKNTFGAKICIKWLKKSISKNGFFLPRIYLYADQNWLSCLPWYFPSIVGLNRSSGFNVAYWNLFERTLSFSNGTYFSNASRLVFIHFSGYDPIHPSIFSRHSSGIFKNDQSLIENILHNYCEELLCKQALIPAAFPDLPCCSDLIEVRLRRYLGMFDNHYLEKYSNELQRKFGLKSMANAFCKRFFLKSFY